MLHVCHLSHVSHRHTSGNASISAPLQYQHCKQSRQPSKMDASAEAAITCNNVFILVCYSSTSVPRPVVSKSVVVSKTAKVKVKQQRDTTIEAAGSTLTLCSVACDGGGSHVYQGCTIAAHKDTSSILACPNSHHSEKLYMQRLLVHTAHCCNRLYY